MIAGSKIAIAGVGALGGTLAASLARAGRTPLLIARGKRLANLRNHGLRYAADGGAEETHHLPVSSAGTAGPQDVLFLATKSDALPQLLPELIDCIQPGTTVIPIVNGIPWWLFADGDQSPIEAVDPGGVLARLIPQDQIIGCVAFLTASLGDDGVVRSHGACRLTIGDVDSGGVDGMDTCTPRARTRQIARTLSAAGIDTTGVDAIRPVLWTKIALNLATNPLSVVAEATLSQQYAHPGLRHAVMGILSEVRALAAALGQQLAMTDADMLAAIERAGDFRTSMLQDFDAGRPLELNAIALACLELADRVGISMPTATILYHLADWRSARQEGDRASLSTVKVKHEI